jgi:hypothetical protein
MPFICMPYSVLEDEWSAQLDRAPVVPLWTPEFVPSSVPSVPLPAAGVSKIPTGYTLVRSGVTLGYSTPPDGAVFFSTVDAAQRRGAIVNLAGRCALLCENKAGHPQRSALHEPTAALHTAKLHR